jgi:hypothetical protein
MEHSKKDREEDTKTKAGTSGVNMLNKSKYCFFSILAYSHSRAEARLTLSRLSKRG